jgi:hypothetical protein
MVEVRRHGAIAACMVWIAKPEAMIESCRMTAMDSVRKVMVILAALAICLRVATLCDSAMAMPMQTVAANHCEGMMQKPGAPVRHSGKQQNCTASCGTLNLAHAGPAPALAAIEMQPDVALQDPLQSLPFPPATPPPRNS